MLGYACLASPSLCHYPHSQLQAAKSGASGEMAQEDCSPRLTRGCMLGLEAHCHPFSWFVVPLSTWDAKWVLSCCLPSLQMSNAVIPFSAPVLQPRTRTVWRLPRKHYSSPRADSKCCEWSLLCQQYVGAGWQRTSQSREIHVTVTRPQRYLVQSFGFWRLRGALGLGGTMWCTGR